LSLRSVLSGAAIAGTIAIAAPVLVQAAPSPTEEAIAARKAGDFKRAIALLEYEDRTYPDNADTLRLLGTSYAFAGRSADAVRTLEQARALAPRDQDIALALARAYLWSGNLRQARTTADAIAAADPDNIELPALTQGVSSVAIGGRSRTWYESIAALAVPVARSAMLSGEVDHESRAGTADTYLQVRADRRFGRAGSAYVSVSDTPKANFRERWGVRTGGEWNAAAQVTLTLDLRYADYSITDVVVVEPGVRLHTDDERYSLAAKSINLWGESGTHQNGWSVRGEAQPGDWARFFLGCATYPDTEAGITRRVRSVFSGALVPLTDRLELRVTYEHENRVQSYTRDSGIVGLSLRL
jgi:YaiO family outer membrane protein